MSANINIFDSENELEEAIMKQAEKEAKYFQLYHNYMVIEHRKSELRITNPKKKEIHTPSYWLESKLYNPFYVIKHSKQIAKSVYKKLQQGIYSPNLPHTMPVKKANGKIREISVYQIPDAVISKKLYSQLLSKNKHRFSGSSYAYRNDRNAHHAIQDIFHDLSKYPRMFVAEFDFSAFFDSINHPFLFSQLSENAFITSTAERGLIKKFLERLNGKGVPQGTSISLFLANLVCWRLDRDLEREGVRFARYADDTVIWSDSYEKICRAFNIIHEFSNVSGVSINIKKSNGISLLTEKSYSSSSEVFKTKTNIDFLGYHLSYNGVAIKDKSFKKAKKQISYILYRNLLQPLNAGITNAVKLPANDDEGAFASAIHQIRRYMYGNLSEHKLRLYLKGKYKHLKFKGLMSYYPLVDNTQQLKDIDKWLVSTILNCLRLRESILSKHFGSQKALFPYNLDVDNLVEICKIRKRVLKSTKSVNAFVIPSFLRIHNAISRGIREFGLATIDSKTDKYNYD
ncbi:reverse transcriptase domain-containing protein [Hymenobacter sp. BRD67]|uniref:reverse transcriptase domain-containing protein n=1 Tax=Hymenobacter sp. BRD67 TaxID=2675877 RepID=UPI0015659147|nr:reverse transcriptase domain-containing protein [Hymenobacter sp. BRD67]QKG54970.1 RNA-dependent DNA polymerase [Hymenobacter sp. BRD67]